MTVSAYNIIEMILHIALLFSILINAVIWIDWFIERKYRIKGNYALGPLLFSIHALIFLLMSGSGFISYQVYVIWRNIIEIHAIVLLICYGLIMRGKIRSAE